MLYAVHNKSQNSLKMEFHFCTERISSQVASAFVDNFVQVMETIPKIYSKTFMLVQTQTLPQNTGKKILSPGDNHHISYLMTNKFNV